ncbi:hypothetical protein [Paucisalibacillus sp. EB02]|uniref:hypothetical protein n=1 Tax=Paucisalibacillus sp. EB02 TaxID=1347087 RepID=UPI0006940D76|nr:hypothetical protein [Paucisalibacillus sp. EB02]
MKFFRVFVGIMLIVLSFLLFPIYSSACTCVEPLSAERELDRSTAVFRGEVKEIRQANDHDYGLKVLLTVNEVWKGVHESEVTIRTARDGAACGFDFQVGKEYLVYAGTNDAFDNNNLMTGICDRTSQVGMQQAQEDMKVLGKGAAPGEMGEHNTLPNSVVAGLWCGLGVFVLLIFLALRHHKKTDS